MINPIESKKFRMGSGLFQLLPRDRKLRAKNRDKSTDNHNKLHKNKRNGKYNTQHGPLPKTWKDGRD